MWDKIKDILQTLLLVLLIVLVVMLLITQCNGNSRYKEQLNTLQSTSNNIEQSVNSLRTGLGQQESIITELRDNQSELESTVRESNQYLEQLVFDESNVDGSVGAIRSTVHRLESTVNTTIRGIEETGIQ